MFLIQFESIFVIFVNIKPLNIFLQKDVKHFETERETCYKCFLCCCIHNFIFLSHL